ncbi:hypothetical protein I4F81_005957 [Pyropia yezoensis]|uniref:Uncharacterized protein n=1 Tax=Pyropia yezoensis TaxID=2788 RepID=A0ACC3BZE1_PYRYE|nr:hypothetical protein I4F81_005957 [Neopyropia yezoensis]
MAPMPPSDVFSLLCRMVAEVTVKNVNNGNNIPLLLLFRVVLAQRNLAFPHMLSDTVALALYMTLTYQGLKVVPVTKLLAKAFNVPVDHLDVAQRVTYQKVVLNQPADLNGELVKLMLNPDRKKWTWVARNLKLRSVFILGSPTADEVLRQGLSEPELRRVSQTIVGLSALDGTLPVGCDPLITRVAGTAGDQVRVDKLNWAWDTAHVSNSTFEMVSRVLQTRFVHGALEDGSTLASEPIPAGRVGVPDPVASAPTAAARPPLGAAAKSSRSKKRGAADPVEPVLPVAGSVRNLKHHKSKAKWDKGVSMCATALIDDEKRATVVKPPFVIGQVKPFPAWPHGGVVVFAQFPFLLDGSWRDAGRWTANCQKVMVFSVGGRYEVVFTATKPQASKVADAVGVSEEPLLQPASPSTPGLQLDALLDDALDDSISPVSAVTAAEKSVGEGAPVDGAAGPAAPAPGPSAGARAVGAFAGTPAAAVPAAVARAVAASAGTPVAAASAAVARAEAASAGTPAAGAPAAELPAVAAFARTPAAAAPAENHGNVAEDAESTEYSLSSPQGPKHYVPLSEPLKQRFVRALESGKASVPPLDDQAIEWAVLGRSAPSVFSMLCTFSSNLEIVRSHKLPCGTHRSNNYITIAYPARDPAECAPVELD